MTAVATYSSVPRPGWNTGQGNPSHEDISRLLLQPRTSSMNGTGPAPQQQRNMSDNRYVGWAAGAKKKAVRRDGGMPNGANGTITSAGLNAGKNGVLGQNGMANGVQNGMVNQGGVGLHHLQNQRPQNQQQEGIASGQIPVMLFLAPLNATFEKKQIKVPITPDVLKIGRMTNSKTTPSKQNGYFDSKVLSRQHAEIWADLDGRVWIRDVKSSNGTFVNGHRLSQENRESEAHELRSEDVLELGIDIVGEDNKTIIHHKVAAKVEHAGLHAGNGQQMDLNVNFGDLEALIQTNGGIQQNQMQQQQQQNGMRGRSASQGSRTGPMNNVNGQPQQFRPMGMMQQQVTFEMLVKRLNMEMQTAKQQAADLARTATFFESIVKENSIMPAESEHIDHQQQQQPPPYSQSPQLPDVDASSLPPPHPPPSLPLPEAPHQHPILTREPTVTPQNKDKVRGKPDPPRQMLSIVEQLSKAKTELDAKALRLRDLEDQLKKERTAREVAEDRAAQLELAAMAQRLKEGARKADSLNSMDVSENISANDDLDEGDISDTVSEAESVGTIVNGPIPEKVEEEAPEETTLNSIDERDAVLEQFTRKVEELTASLKAAQSELAAYRERALRAESERDADRKTISELVAQIRREDERRARMKTSGMQTQTQSDREGSKWEGVRDSFCQTDGEEGGWPSRMESRDMQTDDVVEKTSGRHTNGHVPTPPSSLRKSKTSSRDAHTSPSSAADEEVDGVVTSRETGTETRLVKAHGRSFHAQAAPYYSIVGVVLIGVSVMAYLNQWQKVER